MISEQNFKEIGHSEIHSSACGPDLRVRWIKQTYQERVGHSIPPNQIPPFPQISLRSISTQTVYPIGWNTPRHGI